MVKVSLVQNSDGTAIQTHLVQMFIIRIFSFFFSIGGKEQEPAFLVNSYNAFRMKGT
jgi:hypothetical protein